MASLVFMLVVTNQERLDGPANRLRSADWGTISGWRPIAGQSISALTLCFWPPIDASCIRTRLARVKTAVPSWSRAQFKLRLQDGDRNDVNQREYWLNKSGL
jgi:hypothetical protein